MPDGPTRITFVHRDNNPEEEYIGREFLAMSAAVPDTRLFTMSGIAMCLINREEAINALMLFLADGKHTDTPLTKAFRRSINRSLRVEISGTGSDDLRNVPGSRGNT